MLAQQLAMLIAKLDGHVVPRGIDVGEARLGEDGGEREVPLRRARRARDDERRLHLHRRRLRAAGGILVVGPPVAVVVHAVAAVLTRRERGRRRGDRARLHGADVAARSLRTGHTPLVRARRRAAGGGIDRRAAGERRARLQEGGPRGSVLAAAMLFRSTPWMR